MVCGRFSGILLLIATRRGYRETAGAVITSLPEYADSPGRTRGYSMSGEHHEK